jgi:hypothetical protein
VGNRVSKKTRQRSAIKTAKKKASDAARTSCRIPSARKDLQASNISSVHDRRRLDDETDERCWLDW